MVFDQAAFVHLLDQVIDGGALGLAVADRPAQAVVYLLTTRSRASVALSLQRATTVRSIVSPGGRRGQQTRGEVMHKIARYALFAFGLVLLPISASAGRFHRQAAAGHRLQVALRRNPEVAVHGDTSKPGLYVQRVKFAPSLKVMPDWHPEETRTLVVLSGTLSFRFGDTWDESKLTAFPAGAFFAEPRKTPHLAWAKDGEVIVQVTGVGPAGVTFTDQSSK
jgi:hypothetical protein